MNTLVPFIRQDCHMPRARMTATGCSVGALYSSIFVRKHPGAALERVRRHAHLTLVVGRGAHDAHEESCIPETGELGAVLKRKHIPHHLAFWGRERSHAYPWWQKQALHYLSQLV